MAVDLERLRTFIADNAAAPAVAVTIGTLTAMEREISELRAAEAMRGANLAIAGVVDRLHGGIAA